jgi:Transglutaminase-like superfamily
LQMYSWEVLDPIILKPGRVITAAFVAAGINDFRAAAAYVHSIPYGRTSNRDDPLSVLREDRGTCSTKHALLSALAQEQNIEIALVIGIYRMNGRNSPGVGEVLEKYGLDGLPEAHCFLRSGEMRIDLTRVETTPPERITEFIYEEEISPDQIGEYKTSLHRRFLSQRIGEAATAWYSLDELWQIRESCIAALAAKSRTSNVFAIG